MENLNDDKQEMKENESEETKVETSEDSQDAIKKEENVTEDASKDSEEDILKSDNRSEKEAVHEEHEVHEEHDEHEEHLEADEIHLDTSLDFETMTPKEILHFVKSAAEKPQGRNINKQVQTARSEFLKHMNELKAEALEHWKSEGNEESTFKFEGDTLITEFNVIFRQYKKARQSFISDLNNQKEENLKRKKEILERLKELTESDETGSSFNEFKKLQDEWRSIGHVPIQDAENIWNSYNFFIDKFYEQRSLYSEFKELDRKRNLTAKEEVISKIEALDKVEDINEAMKLLKSYTDEWKHIGPVPKESTEKLLEHYRAAVINQHERKEKQSEELQKRREQNYEAKFELLGKIEEIAQFKSDKVQEWINKNEELGQWIENWRSIGSTPIAKSTDLKERFSNAIRNFNRAKNDFFRNRKKEKVDNLKKKLGFCERIENINAEEDPTPFKKEVIKLQEDWKKIGPLPGKYSDKIWKRFQSACDAFFAKLGELYNQSHKDEIENLEKKNNIIGEIDKLAESESQEGLHDKLKSLQKEWNAIGYVPFKEKDKIRKRYQAAISNIISKLKGSKDNGGLSSDALSYELTVESWSKDSGGDRRIEQERQRNQREIKKLENEVATLENNIEFLSRSKTAEKLKVDLEKQIDKLKSRISELEQKQHILRSVSR